MKHPWTTGYIQDTHRYNPDYSYLDKGHYTNWQWRVLSTHTSYSDDGDIHNFMRVKVRGEHDKEEVAKALRDAFRRGCSCEYDCCGHLTGGMYGELRTPKNHRKGEYMIEVDYAPNY